MRDTNPVGGAVTVVTGLIPEGLKGRLKSVSRRVTVDAHRRLLFDRDRAPPDRRFRCPTDEAHSPQRDGDLAAVLESLDPLPGNPVLTAGDVTDYGRVNFVADPFVVPGPDGRWHLFVEVFNFDRDPTGVIGHATSSDGVRWTYDRVVLNTGFHLSFPYVFRWEGDYFMVPQQRPPDGSRVTLYRANPFPTDWEVVTDLLQPTHAVNDQILFRWADRWWLLVGVSDEDALYAYYATDLLGKYRPHDANPVARRPDLVRPAGRPLVGEDAILTFFQDCGRRYGHSVHAYHITELTPNTYNERVVSPAPLLAPAGGAGWNGGRMHHLDLWPTEDGWLGVVDGDTRFSGDRLLGEHWSVGLYAGPPQ